MTTTQIPVAAPVRDDTPPVQGLGAARVLAGVRPDRALPYAHHLTMTGALTHRSQEWLVEAAREVGLLGRGGGAFPVAVKLAATPAGRSTQVLVNGSESDPTSWKDRVLMRRAPHRVLDGALVVAAALGTRHVTIAAHDPASLAALQAARAERRDAADVTIVPTPAGFVGGEARSVIHAVAGEHAVPDGRRVLPTERGIDGRPTFVSNAETFAQLGVLALSGIAEYAALGTIGEAGTSLVTLLGVPHAGVGEVVHGASLDLLTGPRAGRPMLLGGVHGAWTTAEGLTLDRASLRSRGLSWGAGVVAVLPESTCALGEVTRVAHWLAASSAGQCGPCLFGLASVARDLVAIYEGGRIDLDGLRARAGLVVGRGACSNPDGTVRFIATALDAFADEVERHRTGHGCGRPIQGYLPVPSVSSAASGSRVAS
ncbi:NADH-ubiquinone oxidoreductase-F iron-sulfur binding region domain-containing protein [Nocardioides sp.]|uniref:NADH-ubiquinone oxidoreductase-F iron-sulfur binding region domain-containing protein n=1 Tax=Nocardioides sp. TaxID=35761 RepID=UPI0026350B32|nr:NADH-ubiquinone oxidoreductase-F iron-sulfur binding region domain-containing protein [Nocardioides sp.]